MSKTRWPLRDRITFRWYHTLWKLGVWVPPTATVRYWSKDWKLLGTDHGQPSYYRNPLPAWRAKVLRMVLSHIVSAVDCTSGKSVPSIDGDHALPAEGLGAGPLRAGTTREGHVPGTTTETIQCTYPVTGQSLTNDDMAHRITPHHMCPIDDVYGEPSFCRRYGCPLHNTAPSHHT